MSRPTAYSDSLSGFECLVQRKLWRLLLEVAERELYALNGAIDTLQPLWFEYGGSAETSDLYGSITSVGKCLNRRRAIVFECERLASKQVALFDARSSHHTETSS
jgi:hypothetical protein